MRISDWSSDVCSSDLSPDMRIPIAHALAWPKRIATPCRPLDLACIRRLDFAAPDENRFPALRVARQAAQSDVAGGADGAARCVVAHVDPSGHVDHGKVRHDGREGKWG